MEITIGEYTLVHSGTVIQIGNLPINVKLIDEIEGDYTFIFKFSNDGTIKGASSKYTSHGTHVLEIDLINFYSQNAGSKEPVEVGTLRKIPLFLSFRVFELPNCGKTIQFNFYVREVGNGE